VPANKPVIVLHGDQIEIAGRIHLVHVHGFARSVTAPYWYRPRNIVAAAAVSLSAALGGCHENPPLSPHTGAATTLASDAGNGTSGEADVAHIETELLIVDAGDGAASQGGDPSAWHDAGLASEGGLASDDPTIGVFEDKPRPAPRPIEVRNNPPGPVGADPFPQQPELLNANHTIGLLRTRFRACYLKEKEKNPRVGGPVTLKVVVSANGKVLQVSPQGGQSLAGALACIVEVMKSVQFTPSPTASGPVKLTVPIRFPEPPRH
jgi:hypothetical protein